MSVPPTMTQRTLLPGERMALRSTVLLALTLLLAGMTGVTNAAEEAAERPALFYEEVVAPIITERCADCHNGETQEGGLDLSTAEALLRGSESGPVVTPRNSKHSLIYEMVKGGEMPPGGPHLPEEEIKRIDDWITAGARFKVPPKIAVEPPSQHDVLPILLLRCVTCHGAELQRGGLDLRSISSLKKGGENGPAAIAGDPASSAMIQRIEQELCPTRGELLKYFVERPTKTELDTLKEWIAAGLPEIADPPELTGKDAAQHEAAESDHWAFRPLPNSTEIPQFDGVDLPQPIDAFVYAKLREAGLNFSPEATRHQLIRRLYFDLTGVPPTPAELDRWLTQPGDWYTALVDELLASPRYGERWGRYWLDVAGYADSEGGVETDPVRDSAFKYRDYVIRSFNADKPWDRFLLEQLAGDELADYRKPEQVTDEVVDNLIATGFLRMTVDQTGSRTMNFVPERLGLISDVLNVVSTGVMGTTMECARCHSHKYDPIPQTDYYRFKAIFQGAYDEHDWMTWKTRTLDVATPGTIARRNEVNAPLEKEIKALEAQKKKLVTTWQTRVYDEVWPGIDKALQEEIEAAVKVRGKTPTPRQKELIAKYDNEIRPTEAVLAKLYPEFAKEFRQISFEIVEKQDQLVPATAIRALWDRGRPSPTYVLMRGEYNRPGRPVAPGVPASLTAGETPFEVIPPWPGAESTGRRLALARWLTGPDHPLTARVLVNRIWSKHFGRGIVKSLDNFGTMGSPPTHPELLDWLARDFVDGGWSLKSLHRRILFSRTYRQASGPDGSEASLADAAERQRLDPENELLSRMPLTRLDAEALRDALLVVSGSLDERMYGRPVAVAVREDGLVSEPETASGKFRRSIYLQLRRTELPTLLSSFDYPDMQPNCSERTTSTVSTQSLVLMNNSGVHDLARQFARQVYDRTEGRLSDFVAEVYRSAFSRAPSPEEYEDGERTLRDLEQKWRESGSEPEEATLAALTTFCHAVMNSAEFAYID